MPVGAIVHRLETITSTNDIARALAEAGAEHGTAVVAREQTHGRGTKGRAWHSPPGLGLYVSFVLRGPGEGSLPSLQLLPLAAGLAAADAILETAGSEVRLKWPNDLVHGGRKLGGILSEGVSGAACGSFAVVGVGINIGQKPEDFPEDLRASSVSLRTIVGRAVSAEALLGGLCRALDCWYNAIARGEKDAVIRTFEARMLFPPGTSVRVATGEGAFTGVFRGLDAEGRLVVERGGAAGTVVLDGALGLDEAP
jgi:BirA family biotin operon repressor/biotin-[acetyl-CoA-carboxylase] ligase